MTRQTVVVLAFNDLARDPRAGRQIDALLPHYDVIAAGYGPPTAKVKKFVKIAQRRRSMPEKVKAAAQLLTGRYEAFYWDMEPMRSARAALAQEAFDGILTNDVESLPVALEAARGRPLLVDLHEYAPREFEDRLDWRLLFQDYRDYLCRSYLKHAGGVLTVCDGIADEYQRQYGITSKVWINAPKYEDCAISRRGDGTIRIIHHGVAIPSRRLELMMDIAGRLDARFRTDFMLLPLDSPYVRKLKRIASRHTNIFFRDPVPTRDIVRTINEYDLGVLVVEPVNFNYLHALPNKFFECVQARLGYVTGPLPTLAKYVRDYGVGLVSSSFRAEDVARELNGLTAADVAAFKTASDRASRELCAEQARTVLLGEVDRLMRAA